MYTDSYPDIAPTISVDKDYGKYVDLIDFDMQRLTDHMRTGGMTDQDILDTSIVFSAEHPPEGQASTSIYGEYDHRNKTATVYANYHAYLSYMNESPAGAHVDTVANDTLVHEIEHRIASTDENQQQTNARYHHKFVAQRLAAWSAAITSSTVASNIFETGLSTPVSIALGTAIPMAALTKFQNRDSAAHQRYLNNPEEQRCRNAELDAPKVVHVFSKTLVFRSFAQEDIEAMFSDVAKDYYTTEAARIVQKQHELASAKMERLNAVIAFMVRMQSGRFSSQ